MSENKHTPGPWATMPEEVDRPYIRIRGTRLGGRYKVANVLTPDHEGVHAREAVETRANAKLIAAAPDLLEVLHEIAADGVHSNVVPYLHRKALAAIAKATGAQP